MKIGIITIGSLFWDKSFIRQQWRSECLNLETSQDIKLPIRYGRLSTSRNEFTMILDASLPKHDYGVAKLIEAKWVNDNVRDVIYHARRLSFAENIDFSENVTFEQQKLCANFGSIGLLMNPDYHNGELVNEWIRAYNYGKIGITENVTNFDKRMTTSQELFGCPKFQSANGFIADMFIEDWQDFDCILVCNILANNPKPSSSEIVKLMQAKPLLSDTYFVNNVKSGITTKQDDQILLELSSDIVMRQKLICDNLATLQEIVKM